LAIPEFDIFRRVEELEGKIQSDISVKDAALLGLTGVELAFWALCANSPKRAETIATALLNDLKKAGLNRELHDKLSQDLNGQFKYMKELESSDQS
jgi:hypothetical protein